MFADRTGLPRETVRRKVNALFAAGLVPKEKTGRVRTVLDITAPHVITAFKALGKYQKRLPQLGAVRGDFSLTHPAKASLGIPAKA
jgi:hypothetical protein